MKWCWVTHTVETACWSSGLVWISQTLAFHSQSSSSSDRNKSSVIEALVLFVLQVCPVWLSLMLQPPQRTVFMKMSRSTMNRFYWYLRLSERWTSGIISPSLPPLQVFHLRKFRPADLKLSTTWIFKNVWNSHSLSSTFYSFPILLGTVLPLQCSQTLQ